MSITPLLSGRRRRDWTAGAVAAVLLAACGGGSDMPSATDRGPLAKAEPKTSNCSSRTKNSMDKLLECVTLDGVRRHQRALQAIADANGGTRQAGTPGYDASVAYVSDMLKAAGYAVTLQEFPFVYTKAAVLQQIAPLAGTYATGAYTGTGYGDVTANVTPVDLDLGPDNASSSGCEATDFAGFIPGTIALIQRGTCSFAIKATNAEAAGAVGVIIFNQGNSPDREGLIVGTLGGTDVVGIPVVGASYYDGQLLAETGSIARVVTFEPESITQVNVIAETPDGDSNQVVMVGAHLDSVRVGPGINDNGSGSAAILETAIQMAGVKTRNKVRFAWWGAEESGLVGSTHYVNSLSDDAKDKITLYLNFDMIGSPNHVFFIYDGDDSDGVGAGPGPSGSAEIEKVFEAFYMQRGEPYKGTDFSGRSDYGPFIANGIPAGGLFTGAEGIKTDEEAAIWGGTAGEQYDPCYHQACDTYFNNSDKALEVNADAVAHATLLFGMNTSMIVDSKPKGNFKVPLPSHWPLDEPAPAAD